MKALKLASLLACLFWGSAFAADAVYLKALGENESSRAVVDGSSWATAYTDVAQAMDAAQAAGKPLYAAQGIYVLSAKYTVSGALTVYGGFPGVSDGETLSDRDWDQYQTIITGDQALNDVWEHVEPKLDAPGAFTYTATQTPVFLNGKVNLPEFTGDYDTYRLKTNGTNINQAFVFGSGSTPVFDGLWIVAVYGDQTGSGIYVNTVTSTAIRNCRFAAVRASQGVIADYSGGKLLVESTRFICCNTTQRANGIAFRSAATVNDCDFIGGSIDSGNVNGGGCLYFWTGGTVKINRCAFTRCIGYNNMGWLENTYGGGGVLLASEGGYGSFTDCLVSNCYAASSIAANGTAVGGTPLLNARNFAAIGCEFRNNLSVIKVKSGYSYAMFRDGHATSRQVYTGCVFAGNTVRASVDASSTEGEAAVGIVGNNINQASRFTLVNDVFDNNKIEAVDTEDVKIVKCRGFVLGTQATLNNCAAGFANCTFTGSNGADVYDLVQFSSLNSQTFKVVNCVFTDTTVDIRNPFRFDNPSRVVFESVSAKNNQYLDAAITSSGYLFDDIPLAADYTPLAAPPGIRTTADVATNVAGAANSPWDDTFRYKAGGSWSALVPSISATADTDDGRYIGDMSGASRPSGAFTRGAVQAMDSAAESGYTLTIRRDTMAGGTISGPQAQAVAPGGTLVGVTAVPGSGNSFDGWYETGADEPFSTSAALPWTTLDSSKVIIARFAAPPVKITFDLGSYGTFDGTGASTAVIELIPGKAFPAAPAYTINEAYHQIGWDSVLPFTVPAADTTYTAMCVSSAVRVIRVVPAAEACANPDGLTWETAYGSIADAMKDAGQWRGELWIKEGTYVLNNNVFVLPRVSVLGGFAGTETSAAEADPASHPTIITGDQAGDNKWSRYYINGSSYATTSTNIKIWDNGVYSAPAPADGDDSWVPTASGTDTAVGFCIEAGDVIGCAFSGITFTGFSQSAIRVLPLADSTVTIRDCRFLGIGSSVDWTPVYVLGNSVDVTDCEFEGCWRGIHVSAENCPLSSVSVVSNCTFRSMTANSRSAGIYFYKNAPYRVSDCTFTRSLGTTEGWRCSAAFTSQDNATGVVERCVFSENRSTFNCHGPVLLNAGNAVIDDCVFSGNRLFNVTDRVYHSAALTVITGTILVRDSFFGSNTAHIASTTANSGWASAFCAGGGCTTLLNCTFDGNEAHSTSATATVLSGTAICAGGNFALVNCALTGSAFSGNAAEIGAIANQDLSRTIMIINTVAENDAAGYVPVSAPAVVHFGIANSHISGFDGTSVSHDLASNGFLYNLYSASPRFLPELVRSGDGRVLQRRLSGETPYSKAGRPVWLAPDGNLYFYDDEAPAAAVRHWRKVIDKGSYSASVAGLSLETPIVPDAFGSERSMRKVALGPLNANRISTMLIVK